MRPWRASHSWLIAVFFFLSSCLSVIQLHFCLFFYQRWIRIPYLFSSSPSFFLSFFRVAFAKESEVLTGNLGDKLIPQNEILRDVSDLKALANLHESMEWLAARLKAFFATLPQTQGEWSVRGLRWWRLCAVNSVIDAENWQDSMPTCLKTMTWKDSCIFRRLTIKLFTRTSAP